jgi:hypothetical protein
MSATERSEMAERRARYMRRHVTEQLVARPRSRSRRPRSATERRRDPRALEERVRALESRLHTADDETRTVLWRKGLS